MGQRLLPRFLSRKHLKKILYDAIILYGFGLLHWAEILRLFGGNAFGPLRSDPLRFSPAIEDHTFAWVKIFLISIGKAATKYEDCKVRGNIKRRLNW